MPEESDLQAQVSWKIRAKHPGRADTEAKHRLQQAYIRTHRSRVRGLRLHVKCLQGCLCQFSGFCRCGPRLKSTQVSQTSLPALSQTVTSRTGAGSLGFSQRAGDQAAKRGEGLGLSSSITAQLWSQLANVHIAAFARPSQVGGTCGFKMCSHVSSRDWGLVSAREHEKNVRFTSNRRSS